MRALLTFCALLCATPATAEMYCPYYAPDGSIAVQEPFGINVTYPDETSGFCNVVPGEETRYRAQCDRGWEGPLLHAGATLEDNPSIELMVFMNQVWYRHCFNDGSEPVPR